MIPSTDKDDGRFYNEHARQTGLAELIQCTRRRFRSVMGARLQWLLSLSTSTIRVKKIIVARSGSASMREWGKEKKSRQVHDASLKVIFHLPYV